MSKMEFGELCTSKGLQVYIIEFKDLQDFLSDWKSVEMVAAMRSKSDEGSVK